MSSKFYTNVALQGNYVLCREIDNDKKTKRKVKYQPSLFLLTNKESQYRTLSENKAEKVDFSCMKEARNFLKDYKDTDTEVYGNTKFQYTFIADEYIDDIDYDINQVTIAYIDIETSKDDGYAKTTNPINPITAITMKVSNTFYVFGTGDYEAEKENIKYFKCEDEKKMIDKFVEVFRYIEPDIISGWNVKFYDVPYLVNRCAILFGLDYVKKLSVWNQVEERKSFTLHGEETSYDIIGVSILDYMELYKKFCKKQESYKLNYIVYIELGEKKIDYSEYTDIDELRKNDYQKFIRYNIHDTELVARLEEKLQLINMTLSLAYNAKVNYEDVFSQTRMWDAILFSHFKKNKLIFSPDREKSKDHKYAGAYVKDPVVGRHEWIVSFDLDSLYPNLIMQFNVSPEKLSPRNFIENAFSKEFNSDTDRHEYDVSKFLNRTIETESLKDKNLSLACNGHCFKTDSIGVIPDVLSKIYDRRNLYKKKMIECEKLLQNETDEKKKAELKYLITKYNMFQMTNKVCANSLYGALGTPYFRFFDTRLAEAITLSGQFVIQFISNRINEYINKIIKKEKQNIIYSDTDSVYVSLSEIVKKYFSSETDKHKLVEIVNKFSNEKLQGVINKACVDIQEYLNCSTNRMRMKREVIADVGIWKAKKNYVINVYDKEGIRYKEPKIKMVGIEAMRSSTPEICRKEIKNCVSIIMNKSEADLQSHVAEFKKQFFNSKIEDIAFPRGCNGLEKYTDEQSVYKKATPIAVRGALLYNNLLKKKKLTKKYPSIVEGEKIKFIYLKMPNPIHENIIAFLDTGLPSEFNLEKYIDYDLQFESVFAKPVKNILDVVDWTFEKQNSVLSFFE